MNKNHMDDGKSGTSKAKKKKMTYKAKPKAKKMTYKAKKK